MDSDSESQDSDDGRRFRFETTRKDAVLVSQSKRKVLLQSPDQRRRMECRSRSRNRISRDNKSRYSKDDLSRKSRSPHDTINKYLIKDKGSKDTKNNRDSNSKGEDSRNYRINDSRNCDSRDSRAIKNHSNIKYKYKAHDKYKKYSRGKSREKSDQFAVLDNILKTEDKKTNNTDIAFISMEMDEVEKKNSRKQRLEDNEKVNLYSGNKVIESDSSNSIAISDVMMSLTSTMVNTKTSPKKQKSFFDKVVNKKMRNRESLFYGPVLSLELEKKIHKIKDRETHINDSQTIIGPILPANLTKSLSSINEKSYISIEEVGGDRKIKEINKHNTENKEDTFGPALPPYMETHKVAESMLLENLIFNDKDPETDSKSNTENDIIGPLPVDYLAIRDNYVHIKLEERAKQIKAKFKDEISSAINRREEWMVELPPARAVTLGFSSIPRKFKTIHGPDLSDRSIWTDTPNDKCRKQNEKKETQFLQSEEPGKKIKKWTNQVNDDAKEFVEVKCESLLDMHLKSLKRKKKKLEKESKELGLSIRRPFNRDIDLQINNLDNIKKKEIFKKASRLNDRFTSGNI